MSADFIRYRKCPLCNKSGCRESISTGLIFCHDPSINPVDYIYRGQDQWGFGMWQSKTDADTFSQQAKDDRELRRREFLAAEHKRRQQQIDRQMPLSERDRGYKKLLSQLQLNEGDRQRLLARGFNDEQIIADGYRSVVAWQKVQGLSLSLPGVLPSGSLNIAANGILCPIKDKDGQLVGMQARLHESMDGRYRWMTSATQKNPDGATAHVNGELPLGVYEPQKQSGDSIWLVEGTTIKPSLVRNKLSVPTIGAAGGRFSSSPETAKASVKHLSDKYGMTLLTFALDAGDVINQCGVPERWMEQIKFFRALGYTCQVAWWGQITKEDDDIDELTDYSVVTYISPEAFWSIVCEHRVKKETVSSKDSNTPEKIPSDWAYQQWLKSRQFTPDIVVDQGEFNFPDLPEKNIIVAVKSGLGTGKTKALIQLMKLYDHIRSMVIGYRNNLLLQTINRAIAEALTLYHLREDDGIRLLADIHTKLLFCLDSIHLVDGYFKGIDLYIDEIVSVLIHATGGGTLGDNQAQALKIFTRALQVCNRVFILDGNLADIHADFIAKLAPSKRLIKIENKRKIPSHTIKIVDGIDDEDEIKKGDRSPLIQMLLQPDIVPWIFCDSKDRTKILGKILSDKGRRGYVLNSETSEQDWAKEFLENADQFILKYKPEFMILSPTAESGVSVTIKGHFTDKFSFFVGVQGTNSQHQGMFRLRDETITHYVFCPERSQVLDRSNPQTYSIKQFQKILNERILQSGLLASQSADNQSRASEIIAQAIARQDDQWWNFSCHLGALDNYEMTNLRKCLIHALQEAGHSVEILQWDINENITALERQTKKDLERQKAQELYLAVEYETVEEAAQKAKSSPGLEVQRRIEKTFLLDKIPGIKDHPIWSEDFIYECYIKNKRFIPSAQRFWMVQNIEISQKRHEAAWFYHATREDFFSARVKGMSHDVIWALKELNICQFIGIEYNKNSSNVIALNEALHERADIRLALKITIKPRTATGDERMENLGSVLSLIGHKNCSLGKKIVDGVRLMHYTAKPSFVKSQASSKKNNSNESQEQSNFDFETAQTAVMEAIAHKFQAWMESDKAKISWEPKPEPENIVIVSVTTPSPFDEMVTQLQQAQRWEDIILNQEDIDSVWQILELKQQQRLLQLYENYQQRISQSNSNAISEIFDDDRVAMLVEVLPDCDSGEMIEELISTLLGEPNIIIAALRSLSTEIRSRVFGFCDQLRLLFSSYTIVPTG